MSSDTLAHRPGALSAALRAAVGDPRFVADDPDVVAGHLVAWTGERPAQRATVVRPGSVAEVAEVLRACRTAGVPVVAQGGNTGLVGGSVPPADGWVVLATDRLDRVDDVDLEAGQVTAGAGVTLGRLAEHLAGTGWRYGVDFGARDRATVGGSIATNAGGTGVLRHGDTRHQLLGVEAVLADGRRVGDLRAVEKDNTGYDLAALVAGSEGTLAVVTAARLRLVPDPPERCTALVPCAGVAEAAALAWRLRRRLPELDACELLGPGCAALVAEHRGRVVPGADAPAALLVEVAGDDGAALVDRLAAALGPHRAEAAVATETARRGELWAARHGVTEALAARGPVLKLDVSIPAAALVGTVDAMGRHLATAAPAAALFTFGHVCDHNLHLNVLGLREDERASVEADLLARVAAVGGSISAEHGIGRRRRPHLALARTADEVWAMAALKAAWDPTATLNPGVLFDPLAP